MTGFWVLGAVSSSSFWAENIAGICIWCVMSQAGNLLADQFLRCWCRTRPGPPQPGLSHEEAVEVIRARHEEHHSPSPPATTLHTDTRPGRPGPRSATYTNTRLNSSSNLLNDLTHNRKDIHGEEVWNKTNILTEICISSI